MEAKALRIRQVHHKVMNRNGLQQMPFDKPGDQTVMILFRLPFAIGRMIVGRAPRFVVIGPVMKPSMQGRIGRCQQRKTQPGDLNHRQTSLQDTGSH